MGIAVKFGIQTIFYFNKKNKLLTLDLPLVTAFYEVTHTKLVDVTKKSKQK